MTGSSNANEFQYTGRENEGNGLYYYRARYYSPLLGRFINQDPLGFAGGGTNFYIYVGDTPTNGTDPSGQNYNLTQSGDTVYVNVAITLYGGGASAALAKQWQDAIYNVWNGQPHHYYKCKVQLNIQIGADPTANYWTTAHANPKPMYFDAANFVYVNKPGSGKIITTGVDLNNSRGDWDRTSSSMTVAHEFGHFLGFWDHYYLSSGAPWPGHEKDIMADHGGTDVSDDEINSITSNAYYDHRWILAGRGCRCK